MRTIKLSWIWPRTVISPNGFDCRISLGVKTADWIMPWYVTRVGVRVTLLSLPVIHRFLIDGIAMLDLQDAVVDGVRINIRAWTDKRW